VKGTGCAHPVPPSAAPLSLAGRSNYFHPDVPDEKKSGGLLQAISLGLLTFVVTAVVALVITIPFFFLGKVSESFNPLVIIAEVFGLRELGGFFAAQFILILFLALLGDFGTAIISCGSSIVPENWRLSHSFRHSCFKLSPLPLLFPRP
jgi:hypothetical protein